MFLGQLLVDPTNVQQYVAKHGEALDESAGLFQRAGAFKLAVTKGKIDDLENEIEGLTQWRQNKIDQLNSMGKPKGPGGVRDVLNVQSQIAYTEQEIMRKSGEIESIIATTEQYGPGALQLKYQGPETRRLVEMISTRDIEEGSGKLTSGFYGPAKMISDEAVKTSRIADLETSQKSAGFSALPPSLLQQGLNFYTAVDKIAPGQIDSYIGGGGKTAVRVGSAIATFGASELIPAAVDFFFGGNKHISGEGVKGYITEAGKDFTSEQASVAMINKMQSGVQAIYSPTLGKTPILTKVAPRNEAREIKNVGVNITPGSGQAGDVVQSKAIYGGLLSGPPETQHVELQQALMIGGIAALAVWFVLSK